MTASASVKALLLVAVVFGVTFVVGVDLTHCVLLALSSLVVVQLRRLPPAEDEEWPQRPADPSDRGVRREVSRLSWSLHGYESRVDHRSLTRLRAIAARRLRTAGIDLDDPADADRARDLLGPGSYAAVTSDRATPPRYDLFARAVAAVEALPTRVPAYPTTEKSTRDA